MSPDEYAADMAEKLAGNWRKFPSFGWHNAPSDAENWAIVYTNNRDSGLLELSNAEVIERELEAFDADVRAESHSHWACGWVDGFAIRVRDADGQLTPAFRRYCELAMAIEDYPVLDSDDYSRREFEAAIENIETELILIGANLELAESVHEWLWNNEQGELENYDDHGAYPSRESVERALGALGVEIES